MTKFFDESVAKLDSHGKKVLSDHIGDDETLFTNPVKTPEQLAEGMTPSGGSGGGGTGVRGATGPTGPSGATGSSGSTGSEGAPQWTGNGPPEVIPGSQSGDIYLDLDDGKLYRLT